MEGSRRMIYSCLALVLAGHDNVHMIHVIFACWLLFIFFSVEFDFTYYDLHLFFICQWKVTCCVYYCCDNSKVQATLSGFMAHFYSLIHFIQWIPQIMYLYTKSQKTLELNPGHMGIRLFSLVLLLRLIHHPTCIHLVTNLYCNWNNIFMFALEENSCCMHFHWWYTNLCLCSKPM